MTKFLPLILIVLLASAACQAPSPEPVSSATPVASAPTPTPAPVSAPTDLPTPTSSPTPALTNEPTLAPTIAPAATPAAPTATPAPTSTPVTTDAYVNVKGLLNLRASPSMSAAVLRILATGTHLIAIGQPTAPDAQNITWQNVRPDNGRSGWVVAKYLRFTKPPATRTSTPAPAPTAIAQNDDADVATKTSTPAPAPTAIAYNGYVYVASVGGLNLRAEPSTSSRVLDTLASGERLQTNGLKFGPDDDGIIWLNVKIEIGVVGWTAEEFVSTQVPSVAPAAPPTNEADIAAELLRRTNDLRQQNGLPPYSLNDDLTQLALTHSQYMAQNGITHIDGSGVSASKRIRNAGYGAGRPTENIFGGQASIDDAWDYWRTDPPHLDNLLNPFNTVIGIGVYKAGLSVYYTQDFGKPAQ